MIVALCFFGLTRSLKLTYPSIETQIFNILKTENIPYDVYLHTYDLKVLTNTRSKEIKCTLDPLEYSLLNPYKKSVQNQATFDNSLSFKSFTKHGDPWNDKYQSLRNLLRQLNSLNQVTQLWMSEEKQYDAVIYLRPDLEYLAPFPIDQLYECIKTKDRSIYTPAWHQWRGLNDRLAMGTPEIMQIYGSRFLHASKYASQSKLHAERYLKHIIFTNNITNKHFEIYGNRVRSNGKSLKDVRNIPKKRQVTPSSN